MRTNTRHPSRARKTLRFRSTGVSSHRRIANIRKGNHAPICGRRKSATTGWNARSHHCSCNRYAGVVGGRAHNRWDSSRAGTAFSHPDTCLDGDVPIHGGGDTGAAPHQSPAGGANASGYGS